MNKIIFTYLSRWLSTWMLTIDDNIKFMAKESYLFILFEGIYDIKRVIKITVKNKDARNLRYILNRFEQYKNVVLLQSCIYGYKEGCKIALCFNTEDEHNKALKYAARYGHEEIVKYLLCDDDKKEKKNYVNLENVLILASAHGHVRIVRLFIERGVNVHAQNDAAFILACKYGHISIVEILLKHHVFIAHDRIDEALLWASHNNHINIVKYITDFNNNAMTTEQLLYRANYNLCIRRDRNCFALDEKEE